MQIRRLCLVLALASLCWAEVPGGAVRGRLTQQPGKPPAVETSGHKLVSLDGDEATKGVLNDKRLAGKELELKGHFTAPDRFTVDPIHTESMFVIKNGKPFRITYWCDVCAIRTYTPGICVCCQKYTDLDLLDPEKDDSAK